MSDFLYVKHEIITYPNGYSISIIPQWYGNRYRGRDYVSSEKHSQLYEIAVLDEGGEIQYDTPIHDGSLPGYLTKKEVAEYCKKVEALPKRETDTNGK